MDNKGKTTPEMRKDIRQRYFEKHEKQIYLARMFHVGQTCISRIILYKVGKNDEPIASQYPFK